jgi:hypothetical protein
VIDVRQLTTRRPRIPRKWARLQNSRTARCASDIFVIELFFFGRFDGDVDNEEDFSG